MCGTLLWNVRRVITLVKSHHICEKDLSAANAFELQWLQWLFQNLGQGPKSSRYSCVSSTYCIKSRSLLIEGLRGFCSEYLILYFTELKFWIWILQHSTLYALLLLKSYEFIVIHFPCPASQDGTVFKSSSTFEESSEKQPLSDAKFWFVFLDFIRDHNDITTVHQSLVFPVFLPFIRAYHDIIISKPQCISHCICFAFKMISVFCTAGCTNHFYPS